MRRQTSSPSLCVYAIKLWLIASVANSFGYESPQEARYLRGIRGDMEAAPADREFNFYFILGLAIVIALVFTCCFWRDITRRRYQDSHFQLKGGLEYGEGGTEKVQSSAIEQHIESTINAVMCLNHPLHLQFIAYLEDMQILSPVYSSFRCLYVALRYQRTLSVLLEKSAPLSIILLSLLTRAVNLIVCSSILVYLFLTNPGICTKSDNSKVNCLRPLSLDGHTSLCTWNDSSGCFFDDFSVGSRQDIYNSNVYYYFIFAVLSILLSAPLNLLCEWGIKEYADAMRVHAATYVPSQFSMPTKLVECKEGISSRIPKAGSQLSNIQLVQTPPETIIRAVRYYNLQNQIDKVALSYVGIFS